MITVNVTIPTCPPTTLPIEVDETEGQILIHTEMHTSIEERLCGALDDIAALKARLDGAADALDGDDI
jgi:hypothetical protein